mgnify:CR=1 FL=1
MTASAYTWASGTSMAVPAVAGAAALYLEVCLYVCIHVCVNARVYIVC